jgi:hypothetical protein
VVAGWLGREQDSNGHASGMTRPEAPERKRRGQSRAKRGLRSNPSLSAALEKSLSKDYYLLFGHTHD